MIMLMHWTTALLASLLLSTVSAAQEPQPKPAGDPPKPEARGQREEKEKRDLKTFVIGQEVDGTIALPDLDGKAHKLADLRGKIVVIDFWSIQCPISKGYEARLKAIAEEYGRKNIVFLAINSNHTELEGDLKPIREYVMANRLTYTVLLDRGNVVADRFGGQTTPHLFVLDAKGVLRYTGAVDDDQKGEKGAKATHYLRLALDEISAGKPVATATSKPVGCPIKRVPPTKDEKRENPEKKAGPEKQDKSRKD